MKALVDDVNSNRPPEADDPQHHGSVNIDLKGTANTQSYTSFGNHVDHIASFGDKEGRASAWQGNQSNQGASCSTTRSQVSQRLAGQGSRKVLDILAAGLTRRDDESAASSLCEGSVRERMNIQTINFEGSIGQELPTLNNSTQMTTGQGSTESRAQQIMTPIYAKKPVKEDEAKPVAKCTVKTKSPNAVRNASKMKQTLAQGKTVATYRHDVDTGSIKGSQRSSAVSQSQRSRPKSGSSIRGSKKRNSRSKSQRSNTRSNGSISASRNSRSHFNEQIKALMKGNRQQPLVKVPKPGQQKQRHTEISTVFSNDDNTEISQIDKYSSGSESASYLIQPESHLNERALEIQILEQQRQEIAESNRMRQQEIAQLLAEKEKDSQARDFINQAFDNFKEQFNGNPLTQRAGSRADLALSETDNDENDYNYLNMPQQIHNVQNGRLSKLTYTEKSNFYDLTQSPLPYQEQSDVRSVKASDVSAPRDLGICPSDTAPAPRTAQVVKEELTAQPDMRPVMVLAESQSRALSSRRTSQSNQNSYRGQRTQALSQRQKSPLVTTNSARADSARRRLDTLKESARTHKTKACGVLKKAQVQDIKPSKVLLIDQSKPKLPKKSKNVLNNTAHVGQRKGSMRRKSKSRSNSRNKTQVDIRDTSATRIGVEQSSKGFGSSFIMSVARRDAPNEIDNQIYSTMKPSAAQSERTKAPQRLACEQRIAAEAEARSQDPDVEFVQFLKSIQLYCQQAGTPRSRDGHHLYGNLQFLRERYQQFQQWKQSQSGSEPASAQGVDGQQRFHLKHLEEYLKSGNYNEWTRNQALNEDLRSLVTGPQAEFRSHEYPALLTSLSLEDRIEGASPSSAVVQPRVTGGDHLAKTKDDHILEAEVSPSNELQVQVNGLDQTKTKQQPRKAKQECKKDIPEKHQKQIDFIDAIYNQVVLKKDARQEKKKNDIALGLAAQAKIKEIQKNYPQRDPTDLAAPTQTRTYDSRSTQNYTTGQTQQSQSQSMRSKKSSIQRFSGTQAPNEFSLNKVQHRQQPRHHPGQSVDSDVNRGQYSGYFQQPSVQGQDITVPRFEMLNQDLDAVADSLRATEDLKRVCEELHQAKKTAEDQQSHQQTLQFNQVDSLSNPMLINQNEICESAINQSHNDTAPHFTHTTRANHLSQTLESYDGQILSQHTCITPHTLRQTISDDNNDLVAQVQMLQQRIGDPRALSAAQLGETLAVLTQTANELKKACEGISEFTQVLGQAHTTRALEQQNQLQDLPQGANLTRNALQMELQQQTANTCTTYELTQTQQTAEREGVQHRARKYAEEPNIQHNPAVAYFDPMSGLRAHGFAARPEYVDSVCDILPGGQPGAQASGLQSLSGPPVALSDRRQSQTSYLQTNPNQSSFIHTEADINGHQASAPQLEQQHMTLGQTVGGGWHGEQLAPGHHHHELLSRSIDSFANSDNQGGTAPSNHHSQPTQDKDSYMSMNPALMVRNSQPALPSSPRLYEQTQSRLNSQIASYLHTPNDLQTPSREIGAHNINNTTNRDFERRPSAHLVPNLKELPSDKRSQYTYTKSNFIDQDQGYLLSKSPATATVNTSRLHSLYGRPGEIKYVESSKESSQYGLLSSRRPSGILDSAQEYEITQTYRSGNIDADQDRRDAAIEEQQKAAKRAQLAQAYPNTYQAPSMPYPEQQTPKQYVHTDQNTMRSPGRQPSDIAASAGRGCDVRSEQTLSPDEFEKAMKARADDSMMLKGYLNSTGGDEELNFLAQESSAKGIAKGQDQLSSPPAMSPAARPASGAIPLQQTDSTTYFSNHQDFRLATSASQPCHSVRSPSKRSTGGYYSNLLPQQLPWPSSLQHGTLDNTHLNQR